ncbi:MAG TPA: four helix bundle protein [Candidatus Didemnitutus sp.]|nr:four helix bundle protein [Candidatus Didemnitutus sp.]
MKERTKRYGVRIVKLASSLPRMEPGWILGRQLLRSGTSVGANYRAACRAKSRADFINKLKIAEEECDESLYWMELLLDADFISENRLSALRTEGSELLAILVASIRSARTNSRD